MLKTYRVPRTMYLDQISRILKVPGVTLIRYNEFLEDPYLVMQGSLLYYPDSAMGVDDVAPDDPSTDVAPDSASDPASEPEPDPASDPSYDPGVDPALDPSTDASTDASTDPSAPDSGGADTTTDDTDYSTEDLSDDLPPDAGEDDGAEDDTVDDSHAPASPPSSTPPPAAVAASGSSGGWTTAVANLVEAAQKTGLVPSTASILSAIEKKALAAALPAMASAGLIPTPGHSQPPAVRAQASARGVSMARKSSLTPLLIVGAIGIGAFILISMRKKA